jgi:hypothetical protein
MTDLDQLVDAIRADCDPIELHASAEAVAARRDLAEEDHRG